MADDADLDERFDGKCNFVGHGTECEHRTVGPHRAWCFNCSEWCYPDGPCARCELTLRSGAANEMEQRAKAAESVAKQLARKCAKKQKQTNDEIEQLRAMYAQARFRAEGAEQRLAVYESAEHRFLWGGANDGGDQPTHVMTNPEGVRHAGLRPRWRRTLIYLPWEEVE